MAGILASFHLCNFFFKDPNFLLVHKNIIEEHQGSIFAIVRLTSDYSLVRTNKITSSVILWMSEVLLGQKIL